MAGRYNVAQPYTVDTAPDTTTDDLSLSPHWVLVVVRLNKHLSYDRINARSTSADPSEGASAAGVRVITSDCIQLQVAGSKSSHTKSLSATLMKSRVNYLTELLPGDWVLAWMGHGRDWQRDVVRRIKRGEACNGFNDGLKFVGRLDSCRKKQKRDRQTGHRTVRIALAAIGFSELDSKIFYDPYLRSSDTTSVGSWMARMGMDIRELYPSEGGIQQDAAHRLIPLLTEVFVGRGLPKEANTSDDPALRQAFGGGIVDGGKPESAPFAYLAPKEVGDLLGVKSRSGKGGVLAYADLLQLVFGVQKYQTNDAATDWHAFVPDIATDDPLTTGSHRYTGTPMMGAFLPLLADFSNRPLWSVLQQYLNPVINEMYTCLRVNEKGSVLPTMVLRQIPFTTPVLAAKFENTVTYFGYSQLLGEEKPPYTGFMDVPRWVLPKVMIDEMDVGRSNATRVNFVHIYGQNADNASAIGITQQLVQNPPIRDDFDIQRSGLCSFMTTVATRDAVNRGKAPSKMIELIADWTIGSQYTLNGPVSLFGIQAPICEGDNAEFGNTVYHIESVTHDASVDPESGMRSWMTHLTLTNGLRVASVVHGSPDGSTDGANAQSTTTDQPSKSPDPSNADRFPLYPGLMPDDQSELDPGVSVDDDDFDEEEHDDTEKGNDSPVFDPAQDGVVA